MGRMLSRAIAILIAFIFIIIASFSACTSAFRQSLFDVETYKQTLSNQNVYQDILPYVIPVLLENRQTNNSTNMGIDLNDIDQFMSVEDWRSVSDELIPPEWLKTQTESILDSVDRIIDGDLSQRENVLDLSEVIQRLQGSAGQRASEIIIESAPDCTAQQLAQLRQFNSDRGDVLPICKPPPILRSSAETAIAKWFNNLGTNISQVQGNSTLVSIPEDVAHLIYQVFQLDAQLSFLLFLCPLSLIGLIILFAVRNLTSLGRWLGWSFILAGILTMLLIFSSQVPVFESFDDIASATTDVERFEAQIYAGFIRSVYSNASETMLFLAGSMIAVGFILLVISLFGRSHNLLVPEGSILVTEDGRVISATQPQQRTVILPQDEG